MRVTRTRLFAGATALLLALCLPGFSTAESTTPGMTMPSMNSGTEAMKAMTGSEEGKPITGVDWSGAFTRVGSPASLAFMQQVMTNKAVDPTAMFDQMIKSPAFGKILDNVEIQHRILESIPTLKALSGFSEAHGRKLSEQETKAGFLKGLSGLSELMKTGMATIQDPTIMNQKLVEMAKSDDPEIQALFRKGDEASIRQLQNLAGQELFPGVDMSVLESVVDSMSFDPILNQPELARFVDQDPYISQKLRMGK